MKRIAVLFFTWYYTTFVAPLFDPVADRPADVRRKTIVGCFLPGMAVFSLPVGGGILGSMLRGGWDPKCQSVFVLYASFYGAFCIIVVGLYIDARIRKRTSEVAIFIMAAAIQVFAVTGLLGQKWETSVNIIYLCIVPTFLVLIGTTSKIARGIMAVMVLCSATYAIHKVCFKQQQETEEFACSRMFASHVLLSFVGPVLSSFILIGCVAVDADLRKREVMARKTSSIVAKVVQHLSKCEIGEALDALNADTELPGYMRESLLKLVEQLRSVSKFISPQMREVLRDEAAAIAAGTTSDASTAPAAALDNTNPLQLSTSAPAKRDRTRQSVAAVLLIECRRGFHSELFPSIANIVVANQGVIHHVSSSQIIVKFRDASALHSVCKAEEAARTIVSTWGSEVPDLTLAFGFGTVFLTVCGKRGKTMFGMLGGPMLELLPKLSRLATEIGAKVVLTDAVAKHIPTRCMALDVIRHGAVDAAPLPPARLLGISSPATTSAAADTHVSIVFTLGDRTESRDSRATATVVRHGLDKYVAGDFVGALATFRTIKVPGRHLDSVIRRLEDITEKTEGRGAVLPHLCWESWRHSAERPHPHRNLADETENGMPSPPAPPIDVEHPVNSQVQVKPMIVLDADAPHSFSDPASPTIYTFGGLNHVEPAALKSELRSHQQGRQQLETTESLFEMFSEADDAEVMPSTVKDNAGQIWRRSAVVIGEGAFAKVYAGCGETGEQVALKCIDMSSRFVSSTAEELALEVGTMQQLRHNHIVGYISYAIVGKYFFIILEVVSLGSLWEVRLRLRDMPYDTVRRLVGEALQGLQYLHENGIVHCDIKPRNLLLTTAGHCKLSDFGSAVNTRSNEVEDEGVSVLRGTALYMSPEACRGESGKPCDVWSLGVTTLELLTGKLVWTDAGGRVVTMSEVQFVARLGKDDALRLVIDVELPAPTQAFLKLCLCRDPLTRPTAAELLRHPFIAGDAHS